MVARRPSANPEPQQARVPNLNQDPIWSLKSWPATLTVTGQDYNIPALPAADWLALLMVEQWSALDLLTELLAPEDMETLTEELVEGRLDVRDLHETCLDLISQVSARSWWVALRLVGLAKGSWHVLGPEMALHGILPTQVSLAAWLDSLTVLAIRLMDPKDVTMFTSQLEMVPAEVMENMTPEQVEEETTMDRNAFLSLGR